MKLLTLAVLRRYCKVSQRKLAEAVETFQSDISEYENGKPIPEEMAKKIVASLRKQNRKVLRGITHSDLSLPWDEVLLRRAATE